MTAAERWVIRVSAWLGLYAVLLSGAPLAAQRGVAFAEPPLLGEFTFDGDVETVVATSEVGSLDWPEDWVEALARVRACSGVKGDLQGYRLFTVTTGLDGFRVRWRRAGSNEWQEAVFAGWTFTGRKEIYLAQRFRASRQLLEHEMLHAVLASRGMEYWHGSGLADGMFVRCFGK